MTIPTITSVMIDCRDLSLAGFWQELLGVGVRHRSGPFVWLEPQREGGYSLAFQLVPSTTPGKNKLHLDGFARDLDDVTQRVEELGGTRVESRVEDGFAWNVYADPEGNVFCLGHPVAD